MIKLRPIYESLQILDISDEVSFSKEYANYISNSKLSLLNPSEDGNIEKYKLGLSGNKIETSSLSLGSAIHQLVLQPNEYFLAPNLNKPTGKLGNVAEYVYKDGGDITEKLVKQAAMACDYYKGVLSGNRLQTALDGCKNYVECRKNWSYTGTKEVLYLDNVSNYKAIQCVGSVNANKEIMSLLHPTVDVFDEDPIIMNECTILFDVECSDDEGNSTILHLKSNLDNTIIWDDRIDLNDLKTTFHIDQFNESFEKYHYGRQMAFYAYVLNAINVKDNKNRKVQTNMALVSTVDPFTSKVFPVKSREMLKGFKEFSLLLKFAGACELYNYDVNKVNGAGIQ